MVKIPEPLSKVLDDMGNALQQGAEGVVTKTSHAVDKGAKNIARATAKQLRHAGNKHATREVIGTVVSGTVDALKQVSIPVRLVSKHLLGEKDEKVTGDLGKAVDALGDALAENLGDKAIAGMNKAGNALNRFAKKQK